MNYKDFLIYFLKTLENLFSKLKNNFVKVFSSSPRKKTIDF
ncbi:hypothetical protein PRV_00765 [Mycoplasma parvum str. Indiana]|uniref:Uncharacterized protein n=1 Tax=Mycoplasma parvum str. Indiana TaxID=1403316 RepID=U5NFJ5_9MOLU|nr:hypothetical protein PRV_00765 [Mycoplasma parvum str. Indiana]